MNKFILMTRVLEPFIIAEMFVHKAALIKTLLLGSYASKISMRSYIEHHQEGRVPKMSTLLTKNWIILSPKFLDCRQHIDKTAIRNLRNTKGCLGWKIVANESFHELLLFCQTGRVLFTRTFWFCLLLELNRDYKILEFWRRKFIQSIYEWYV